MEQVEQVKENMLKTLIFQCFLMFHLRKKQMEQIRNKWNKWNKCSAAATFFTCKTRANAKQPTHAESLRLLRL